MNEWVVTGLRLVIRLLQLPRALRREDSMAKVGADDLLSGVSESVSESVCESVSDLIHDTYLHVATSAPHLTRLLVRDYRVHHLLPRF